MGTVIPGGGAAQVLGCLGQTQREQKSVGDKVTWESGIRFRSLHTTTTTISLVDMAESRHNSG